MNAKVEYPVYIRLILAKVLYPPPGPLPKGGQKIAPTPTNPQYPL